MKKIKYTEINVHIFIARLLVQAIVSLSLVAGMPSNAQTPEGEIVLKNILPATSILVVATQSVTLKPGFRVSALRGNFNAKIGNENNISPSINTNVWGSGSIIPTNSSTATMNYVKTNTYLTEELINHSTCLGGTATLESIQYFDGLGRPIETVDCGLATTGGDIITCLEYDAAGREISKSLPFRKDGNFGKYLDYLYFSGNEEYKGEDAFMNLTEYELSPLNRVAYRSGPGKDWHGKSINFSYDANGADVNRFTVDNGQLKCNGKYAVNSLYMNGVTDEDGNTSYELKNYLGQMVLKRSVNNNENFDTYYVYNDMGQLCYVIPPLAADQLNQSNTVYADTHSAIKQYCYRYKYNDHGLCIEKVLPGCEPIYMLYDQADRLILSQDGNQRTKTQWSVTKYDGLGRVLYTGLINREVQESEKELIRNNVIVESVGTTSELANTGYTCIYFASAVIPLAVNYYDNYNFVDALPLDVKDALSYDSTMYFSPQYIDAVSNKTDATGMLTGTRTYTLNGTGSHYTVQATYYDEEGRVVQTAVTNHLEGYDKEYNKYNYIGKLLNTFKEHHRDKITPPVTELYSYTYDHAMCLQATSYQLNGGTPVILATNIYDGVGRLKEKKRHSGTDIEQFEYNIRNWPTKIQSGSFIEEIKYNTGLPQDIAPCYNGNIAYSSWTYDNATKGYGYTYDNLSRLKNASFKQVTSTYPDGSFDENFTYDKMGNILTLQRKTNNQLVDNLTLHYANNNASNQLDWITDPQGSQSLSETKEYQDVSKAISGEFAYDANGNMVKDLDRDIVSIQYNVLNLPDVIQFKNGNQIKNTYDAGGRKLGTEYFTQLTAIEPLSDGEIKTQAYMAGTVDQNGTVYLGNFEYTTLNGNSALTTLSRIYNDEGYVEDLGAPKYYYYRRDHLGNNREVWCANTKQTVQRTQYYPSGLPMATNPGDNPGLQERKYNGKELVEMHGLNAYDYGARLMFSDRGGSWIGVDPLAEKYPDISSYVYCNNNPVNAVDPDGKEAVTISAVAAAFAIKGAWGAGVDLTAQMCVNLATNGGQWGKAFNDVDWTGVGAAFVISGLTAPGVSNVAKAVGITVATAADASVDNTNARGTTNVVDGSKSATAAAIDLVAGEVASGASNKLVKGFESAVKSDIASTSFKTLTKAEQSSLKAMGKAANSQGVKSTVDLVAKFTSGTFTNTVKDITSPNNASSTPIPLRPKENSYSLVKPNKR